MASIASPLADIVIEGDQLVIRPRGWHKVGALTRKLEVPLSSIREIGTTSPQIEQEFRTRRISKVRTGSTVPGVYMAGKHKGWGDKPAIWWLVRHPDKVLVLRLEGRSVDRVYIEVGDPAAAAATIKQSISGRKNW